MREHDSRGRHTTTQRELIVLPDGGVLVDTPGLRELQLWEGDAALDAVFADVTAAAGACRFRDCSHQEEPGCAVREAWTAGGVTPERVESYRKLQKELAHVATRRTSARCSTPSGSGRRSTRRAEAPPAGTRNAVACGGARGLGRAKARPDVPRRRCLTKTGAYELAMERLRKKDKDEGVEAQAAHATTQRAAIAEARACARRSWPSARSCFRSKMAALADPDARETLEQEYRRDRERIAGDRDRKIEEIRGGARR